MINKTIARQIINDLSNSVQGHRANALYDYIDDIERERDDLRKQVKWMDAEKVKPSDARGVLCAGFEKGIPILFFGSWVEQYDKWAKDRDAKDASVKYWIDIPKCPIHNETFLTSGE